MYHCREVSFSTAESLARARNVRVTETSAADDPESVDWMFVLAVRKYYSSYSTSWVFGRNNLELTLPKCHFDWIR